MCSHTNTHVKNDKCKTHTHSSSLGKAPNNSLLVLLCLKWILFNWTLIVIFLCKDAIIYRYIFLGKLSLFKATWWQKAWDVDPVVWVGFYIGIPQARRPLKPNSQKSLKVLVASPSARSPLFAEHCSDSESQTMDENDDFSPKPSFFA